MRLKNVSYLSTAIRLPAKHLYTLMRAIAEVKADHNQKLEIEGIVVNQYQKQANLPRQLVEELIAEGLPVLEQKFPPRLKSENPILILSR